MSLHFAHALATWQPLKNTHQWVLGFVTKTEGPVYRKTGAMMLFSDAGHQLGILSGGCLESDLLRQAQKVLALGKSRNVIYDSNDEDGLAWQLGIGCGGKAEIRLIQCNESNNWLLLEGIHSHLKSGHACKYSLPLNDAAPSLSDYTKDFHIRQTGELNQQRDALEIVINPPPHIALFGAGIDMLPIADFALRLGWHVSVIDKRPGNCQSGRLPHSVNLHCCSAQELPNDLLTHIDAAIVATHNLDMDAQALKALIQSHAKYIGLLGPTARKEKVFDIAKLTESSYPHAIAGPLGLALGGDLPENVALAAIAECHAVLFGSNAAPLTRAYL